MMTDPEQYADLPRAIEELRRNHLFWWAGPIAYRNLPAIDGSGITGKCEIKVMNNAPVRLAQPYGKCDPIKGSVIARIFNKNKYEIWAQFQIGEYLIKNFGPLYPLIEAGPDSERDDSPAPWFTSLNIASIILVQDRIWEALPIIERD